MVASGYADVERFTPAMPYRRFFVRLAPLSDRPVPDLIGARDALAFGRDHESLAHVHVMVRVTHHRVGHAAFRDYLRAHPAVRAGYEALKPRIAEREPRALAWFGRQGEC